MAGNPWTKQEDAQLKRRWERAETAAVIGHDVGRTRMSVIGRARRLGYKHGNLLAAKPQARRPKAKPKASVKRRRFIRPEFEAQKLSETPSEPPQAGNYRIDQLSSVMCRFPVTGHKVRPDAHRFCGQASQGGSSYCTDHHAVVYRAVPE